MKKMLINIVGFVMVYSGCLLIAEFDVSVRDKLIKLLLAVNTYICDHAFGICFIIAAALFVGFKVIMNVIRNARGHIG